MIRPKLKLIPDILEEHLEGLAFLWGQRNSALRSPDYSPKTIRQLEDRIEAHVQGLLAGGDQIIPLVKNGLVAEEAPEAFAAAYALLRLQMPAASGVVVEALRQAQEGQLEGVRQALCHGPIELVFDELKQLSVAENASIAVAASEALAFHSWRHSDSGRLELFLSDEQPEVQQSAWRINGQVAFVRDSKRFETALSNKEATTRREALWSAAWTQQQWLPAYCRNAAASPTAENGDAVLLLAVLGKPDELPRMLSLGRRADLGPKRFQILGAYGHPESVEEMIRGMEHPDPRTAVAAGAAFTKITGCDVDSANRVQLPPEDGQEPDDFEKEFLDEAKLPDAEKARAHWQKVKGQFVQGTRWCRGFDLSQPTVTPTFDLLDMESRREAFLRARQAGVWQGTPSDLERFPQKFQSEPG